MKHAIGVDLGGTKIEAALVDEAGNKLDSFRIPTESEKGPEEIANNIQTAVDKVKTKEILGIGIDTPGFIHENKIYSNPNVPGLDKALEIFTDKNPGTIVENDANCFALAEHNWGAGKDVKNMIGIIWGTGIGSGIIIEGKLLRGVIGGAGEVGHIIMDHNITEFKVGGPGTWENLCSGKHIVRRYHEAGGKELDRPNEIFASDDLVAQKTKEETLKWMGMGLGSLVTIFNPKVIVMGGGISNIDVYSELNEEMRKNTFSASADACKVVKNKLGDSAGVLGAAALVFRA